MTEVLSVQNTTWRNYRADWLLFANNLFKIQKIHDQKEKKQVFSKKSSKFYFNPRKPESKGTMVYTSEGYGIIQDPKSMSEPIPIKLNVSGKIKEFDPNQIFLDIPITICFLSSSFKGEEQLTIPITISPKEIVQKIEASLCGNSENLVNVQVFFKGRELLHQSSHTLEKLGVTAFSKFIAVPEMGTPYKISRFTNVYSGWGYSDKCINALAFSVSKSVKIRGFGIFTTDENAGPRAYSTLVRFVKGTDDTGQIILHKEVQVTKSDSAENKIFEFMFDRPIRIQAGEMYSCVQEAVGNYSCCTYYGDRGQNELIGDKDVNFTFSESYASVNNTNRQCGQIPEIYYFA